METVWNFLTAVLASEAFRGLMLATGLIVAIMSVLTARTVARRKQTADMLFNCRNDKLLAEGMATIRNSAKSKSINLSAHVSESEAQSHIAVSVRYLINHYEYLSIGIQTGIYDEAMIFAAHRRTVLEVYKLSKSYIEAMRDEHKAPTLYQELQWLALRWEAKEIPRKFPKPGA